MVNRSKMNHLLVTVLFLLCLFFSGCFAVAESNMIVFPESLQEIQEEAFCGLQNIDDVIIHEGVESIGSRAFADSSIKSITLPRSLQSIAEDALDNIPDLTIYLYPGSAAEDWCKRSGKSYSFLDSDDYDCITLIYVDVNLHEGTIAGEIAEAFKGKVYELSDGMIEVDTYGDSLLGSDDDILLHFIQGGIIADIGRVSVSAFSKYESSRNKLLCLPYVFENRNHFRNFVNSELAKEFLEEPRTLGIPVHGLAYSDDGFRHFFFTKRVADIDSLRRLRIRTSSDSIMNEMISSLGAIHMATPFLDLYAYLQEGRIDGSEQTIVNYKANAFYEVAPWMLLDGHTIGISEMIISDAAWNRLSTEQQGWIQQAATYASNLGIEIAEAREAETIKALTEKGVTFIEVTDKGPWREAAEGVYVSNICEENDYEALMALK